MFDFALTNLGVEVGGLNMYENMLGNWGYDTADEFKGRNELRRGRIF